MPTTHSVIRFSDATGHVLAPVGGLAWLCIGISCKKPISCFDRLWLNWAKVISSGCVCVSHFLSLTSCLHPRLKYHTAYLTFPLGSKCNQHLKFNVSNTKLKMFFPYPTYSSPSVSHFSRWYHLPPSCSGQKNLGVSLGSSLFTHIQHISKLCDAPFPSQPKHRPLHLCCQPHSSQSPFLARATMMAFSHRLFLSLVIHSPHTSGVIVFKK